MTGLLPQWDNIVEKSGSADGITHSILLPFVPLIALFTDQHALTGFGSPYYFESGTHSWFVEAGVGPSLLSDPWEEKDPNASPSGGRTRVGFFAGIGYEFAKHVRVSIELMWSRASGEHEGVEKSWTGASIMMLIALAAY